MKFLICGNSNSLSVRNSTSDKIVLTYFNFRGRGEWARVIMAYAGINYEDRRIEFKDWPALKPKMPNGQLPVLEVNGDKISQSLVICHYLARRAGLCGKDELEAAQAENIVYNAYELMNKYVDAARKGEEDTRPQRTQEFQEKMIPPALKQLDDTLKANGGEWLVGTRITWADIVVADFFNPDYRDWMGDQSDVEDSYPDLAKHIDKINDLPKIKAWIETRPKSNI